MRAEALLPVVEKAVTTLRLDVGKERFGAHPAVRHANPRKMLEQEMKLASIRQRVVRATRVRLAGQRLFCAEV